MDRLPKAHAGACRPWAGVSSPAAFLWGEGERESRREERHDRRVRAILRAEGVEEIFIDISYIWSNI